MIQAIIVEDALSDAELLITLLRKTTIKVEVKAVCTDIKQAYEYIHLHKPELVFLDVELGNYETGFDLLKMFSEPDFAVIFTTRIFTGDVVLNAFHASAVDFLSKRITIEKLEKALDRFLQEKTKSISRTNTLIQNLNSNNGDLINVEIPGREGDTIVPINSICYAKSDNTYTTFYLNKAIDRKLIIVTSISIKDWESRLKMSPICRIHRQYLVNLSYITRKKSDGNGGMIIKVNGEDLPVSRGKMDSFLERYKSHFKHL